MNKVFELVANKNDFVVLKVNAEDTLTIAMNPFISGDMDYITVTKGDDKILTIVKKDGKASSFHWGRSGYTLISESLEMLREKVVDFIEKECYIPLDIKSCVFDSVRFYYNPNFGEWQITLSYRNKDAYIRNSKARNERDMKEFAENFVEVYGWKEEIARTGIKVWKAEL